jgi:alkanesulfonate monooxygenase SsuD/methylene tetrahydromethanopterin reductase-like flavin-dependent oxidoreductase (luciferase family)
MEVGLIQIMPSFGYPGMSDQEVYEDEARLAVLADELGYDHVWVVEHHFEDYSFCPDNFVYLANIAGRTKRIRLATGAVIVPWNIQPLRVAEKAALLDTLSHGRAILGIGRGLSRREFNQFGINMDESRDRFDEATPMILDALESGVMEEHHGKYFDQPRATIRPRPASSFRDRTAQVAMSPESALEAAKLGVQMMAFNYKPLPVLKDDIDRYRSAFISQHHREPKPMLLSEMTVCDTDANRARENAERYCATYLHSVVHHYEMMGEHFKNAKGYSTYAESAELMRAAGMEMAAKGYVEGQIWGTPDQMLRKFEERLSFLGETGALFAFRFGGAPMEVAERSLRLVAKEVMPVLKKMTAAVAKVSEPQHAAA